jgi:hypothetical protein
MSFLLYLSSHPQGAGGSTKLFLENGRTVQVCPQAGDALVFGQSFKLGREDCAHSQFALKHEGSPMKKKQQPRSSRENRARKGWFGWMDKEAGKDSTAGTDSTGQSADIDDTPLATKYVLRSDVLYTLP